MKKIRKLVFNLKNKKVDEMKNGTSMKKFKSSQTSRMMFMASFIFCISVLSGCGQSVDEVTITGPGHQPIPPTSNRNMLYNADLTGTSEIVPTSTTKILGDHSLGGSALRTVSSSLSLRMTSGIGLE